MLTKLLIAGAIASLAFTGLGFTGAASAREARDVSRVVSYSDLDLSHQGEVEELYHRLHRAARSACGDSAGFHPLQDRAQIQACETQAVGEAVASLDLPSLTAMHMEHSHGVAHEQRLASR